MGQIDRGVAPSVTTQHSLTFVPGTVGWSPTENAKAGFEPSTFRSLASPVYLLRDSCPQVNIKIHALVGKWAYGWKVLLRNLLFLVATNS